MGSNPAAPTNRSGSEAPGTAVFRLFVGCVLDAPAQQRAVSVLAATRRAADGARWRATWTKPENLHLSIQFLGDVPAARVGELTTALRTVGVRWLPIEIDVGGLGTFPPRGEPRVLFAGLRAGGDTVAKLAAAVGAVLAPLGFPPEARRFHPHLTLARVKQAPRRARAADLGDGDVGAARLESVRLYRSELGPAGPRYTVLAEVPLAAPPI